MSVEKIIKEFSSHSQKSGENDGKERSHAIPEYSQASHYSQQEIQTILRWFIAKCSIDLNVNPQNVIDRLLSYEDEHEIINGLISECAMRAFIETWIKDGMPHYSSKPI